MYSRGSGVTVCVGWRRLRARISDLALHSFQSPSPTEGQIGCGPESELASRGQRACRKTRETVRGERLPPQRGCSLRSQHRCPPRSCFRVDSSCPSAHSPEPSEATRRADRHRAAARTCTLEPFASTNSKPRRLKPSSPRRSVRNRRCKFVAEALRLVVTELRGLYTRGQCGRGGAARRAP